VLRPPLCLSEAERLQLQRWVRSRTHRHRTVVRSHIVLLASRGLAVAEIAGHLRVTPATVRLWCRRFEEGGIAALDKDAGGRGRRPGMTPQRVRDVLDAMRRMQATGRLTTRRVAAAAGTGATTVWRVWARFGLNGKSPPAEIDRAIAQLISGTK
jgi:transposase